MKPKNYVQITILTSIVGICSCNPDKLDLVNPNALTADTYLTTSNQVQQAVNAIYSTLQTRGLYQRNLYYAMDLMSYEELLNPSAEEFKLGYEYYGFDASHTGITDFWANCYKGINMANFVICNEKRITAIPDIEFTLQKRLALVGEARFLRAFYYFLLVNRFGDIPLVLKDTQLTGLPRSDKSLIWDQIEEDLLFATENCWPKNLAEKGRVTSGAAWALLGKSYLFQANASGDPADFEAAKSAFMHVIDDQENYHLEPRYLDNFQEETEHGPESIFEVEFDASMPHDDVWSAEDGSGYSETTFRPMEYGINNWFTVYPAQDLIDEFETDDPRYHYCIYSEGDLYNNGQDTIKEWFSNRKGWRKYQNYYKQASETQYSGINTKVIRLADVFLMMAEVENELGNISDAVVYLNKTRNRPDVMMPEYGTPAMDTVYPVADKQEIRIAVEHERKVELCGEQVRFDDLVRWRRLNSFITNELFPTLPEFVQYNLSFDPEKNYLWPIPRKELDTNPAIDEEDQNPGY